MRIPKHFRLKIYRRLAVTYFLIVFLMVAGATIVLYSIFSARSRDESIRVSIAMLTQAAHSVGNVYDQVRYVGDQLLSTPEVTSVLMARKVDHLKDYQAQLKIEILRDAYPFIDHIGIYDGLIDRYWNTRLIAPENEKELLARIRHSNAGSYVDCFPHRVDDPGNMLRRHTNVIGFILYPNFRFTPEARMAIVVNVAETFLSKILAGMSVDANERLFILDTDGHVVADKQFGMFLTDESLAPYYREMLRLGVPQGSLTAKMGTTPSLVTFVTDSSTTWRVVSIRSVASLLPSLDRLRRMTFLLTFLILGAGCVLSLVATRFVYGPIDALLTKFLFVPLAEGQIIDEVSLINSALDQTKRLCLKYLLLGMKPEGPPMEMLLASFAADFASARFRVCIVKIDGYARYCRDHDQEERDAHHAALCGAGSEIFAPGFSVQVLVMEENETVLLLGMREEGADAKIMGGARILQESLSQRPGISLSVGIGPVANDAKALCASYHGARAAVSHRFFMGRGSIVDYAAIAARETCSGPYPKSIEVRLLEALCLDQTEEILRFLEEFRQAMSRMPLDRALGHSIALALAIEMRFASYVEKNPAMVAPDCASMETLEEISVALRNYCFALSAEHRERNARRGEEILARMKQYVRDRFQDPSLNLDTVADSVGLSPAYVGKLFKKNLGCSFAGYLNSFRMEKARELLESTELSVSVIADRVGVGNATYLFTLFKKTFADTPQHYRENHGRDRLATPFQ